MRYSSKVNLYLDLDGPIIDFSERSYRAYKDSLNLSKDELPLPKNSYWRMKRAKAPLETIYRRSNGIGNFKEFQDRYLQLIEEKKYLLFDRLHKGVRDFLKDNCKKNRLVLVTLRKNRANLMYELKRLGVKNYFSNILNAKSESSIDSHKIKAKLIRTDKFFDQKNSFIIGDTEADINAGKLLEINTIGVLNGIRSRVFLEGLKPDLIVNDISAKMISDFISDNMEV